VSSVNNYIPSHPFRWISSQFINGLAVGPDGNLWIALDAGNPDQTNSPPSSPIAVPAANPLSFVNGPAYRTFGSTAPYDFPDLAPASLLNSELPKWISFGWEERFGYEGYHNGSFT
jgi:hypothetical protein